MERHVEKMREEVEKGPSLQSGIIVSIIRRERGKRMAK